MYSINNFQFEPSAENIQEILTRAYVKRLRPVCLCNSASPKMYIARRENTYFLKRMPNTGQMHAPNCVSFETPSELSGVGALQGSAIIEGEDGDFQLKLGFSLSKRSKSAEPVDRGEIPKTSVTASQKRLSLNGLLQFLWHNSTLTKWKPEWDKKRYWGMVKKYLDNAVSIMATRQKSLADVVYIPAQFNAEHNLKNVEARNKFMARFKASPNEVAMIIAPFKEIKETQFGCAVVLKHLSDFWLFADKEMIAKFAFILEPKLQQAEFTNGQSIAAVTFTFNKKQIPIIQEITLLNVDHNFIPFFTNRDHELISLLSPDFSFEKVMPIDFSSEVIFPSAFLTTEKNIVAVYAPKTKVEEERTAEFLIEQNFRSIIWPSTAADFMGVYKGSE